jgi:hypothetical protein
VYLLSIPQEVVMNQLVFAVIAISVLGLHTNSTFAASSRDIDKLTTYSVVLGRAAACGGDIEGPSRRVGAWMDRAFPPGSSDQKVYLPVFMQGMQYHAQQQATGKSPDSCASVLKTLRGFPWP